MHAAFDNAVLDSVAREPGRVVNVGFFHDFMSMFRNRLDTDLHLFRGFLVCTIRGAENSAAKTRRDDAFRAFLGVW